MSVKTWFKAATSLCTLSWAVWCLQSTFMNELTLLHWKYVIKISIMHVMHWGKHGETWKKLLWFPENDEEFFLNNTANIWNVETRIITMLLYQNHMKSSSIIHMYHYSLSSVCKLLIDLTKHGKTKLNITKQKTETKQYIISSLPVHQTYVSAYVHLYVHMYMCVCVCRYVCF